MAEKKQSIWPLIIGAVAALGFGAYNVNNGAEIADQWMAGLASAGLLLYAGKDFALDGIKKVFSRSDTVKIIPYNVNELQLKDNEAISYLVNRSKDQKDPELISSLRIVHAKFFDIHHSLNSSESTSDNRPK